MQTLYDVGATVLIPMKVTRIDINKNSEITYKLECTVLDSKRKEQTCIVFADESFIHSSILDENGDNEEQQILDESGKESEEEKDENS